MKRQRLFAILATILVIGGPLGGSALPVAADGGDRTLVQTDLQSEIQEAAQQGAIKAVQQVLPVVNHASEAQQQAIVQGAVEGVMEVANSTEVNASVAKRAAHGAAVGSLLGMSRALQMDPQVLRSASHGAASGAAFAGEMTRPTNTTIEFSLLANIDAAARGSAQGAVSTFGELQQQDQVQVGLDQIRIAAYGGAVGALIGSVRPALDPFEPRPEDVAGTAPPNTTAIFGETVYGAAWGGAGGALAGAHQRNIVNAPINDEMIQAAAAGGAAGAAHEAQHRPDVPSFSMVPGPSIQSSAEIAAITALATSQSPEEIFDVSHNQAHQLVAQAPQVGTPAVPVPLPPSIELSPPTTGNNTTVETTTVETTPTQEQETTTTP